MNFLVCDLSIIDRPALITDKDRFISYEGGQSNWESIIHAPISWHSYAAAMHGRFLTAPFDEWEEHIKWADMILVLWNYNPKAAMLVIQQMKSQGKKVIGAFHENGDTFQLHAKNIKWLIAFKNCANSCDAILTYPRNKIFKHIYKSMGVKTEMLYIPQPYYTAKRKEYIIDPRKRKGIFIASCRKDNELERRNWTYNILIAASLIDQKIVSPNKIFNRITIVNQSSVSNLLLKKRLERLLEGRNFEVVSFLNYHDYLRVIASHQITINLDSSDTQGQVDADSIFVGVPLYNSPELNFRTDFADLYHNELNLSLNSEIAIEKIMNQICTFSKVKEELNSWFKHKAV